MFGAAFLPLAPAVILLLSAFILSIAIPRLPANWLTYRGVYYFIGPVLVGAAILTLFSVRLIPGLGGETAQLIAWRFTVTEPAASIAVVAEAGRLPFLLLPLLIGLVMSLLTLPLSLTLTDLKEGQVTADELRTWRDLSGWFIVAAGAYLVMVSANGLTASYTILIFDALLAGYWFRAGFNGLSVARLFLGLLTAGALAGLEAAPGHEVFLGGLGSAALWLRVGLFPFIELTEQAARRTHERAIYLSLSLTVGLYLLAGPLSASLPAIVDWLTILLLILNGLLAWLAGDRSVVTSHLILATVLVMMLAAPLSPSITTVFSLGLVLSFVALELTPPVGPPPPDPLKKFWFWPYLPALAATITLIGLPFTLGWPAGLLIQQTLLLSENLLPVLVTLLAEALALSGLARYWVITWQAESGRKQQAAIGFVAMTPFLLPGLGPFVWTMVTRTARPEVNLAQSAIVIVVWTIVVAGGAALSYYREPLLVRLKISPEAWRTGLQLRAVLVWAGRRLDRLGKWALRTNVVIEGQHYVGWAVFAAIVGALIILLRT